MLKTVLFQVRCRQDKRQKRRKQSAELTGPRTVEVTILDDLDDACAFGGTGIEWNKEDGRVTQVGPTALDLYPLLEHALRIETIARESRFTIQPGDAGKSVIVLCDDRQEEFTKARMELKREIQLLAQMRPHPCIVRYWGWADKWPLKREMGLGIVMDYYNGGSLRQQIVDKKLQWWKETPCRSVIPKVFRSVLSYARNIAAGMSCLHHQHIVHRDLAARNILITEATEISSAVVADFGFSRVISEHRNKKHIVSMRWAAPEVLSRGLYSEKSDVWSYGVVIWEMLSNEYPFQKLHGRRSHKEKDDRREERKLSLEQILAKWEAEIRLDKPKGFGVSGERLWEEIILRCWEFDPDKRITMSAITSWWDKQWQSLTDSLTRPAGGD